MPSAARTNLTSNDVRIGNRQIGQGEFRVVLQGHYIGGNRNQQEAACKRFKPQYRQLGLEYFNIDFQIIDKTIDYAEEWNGFCSGGREILVNKGAIHYSNSNIAYLVEPLIRNYTKFTSNSGWIDDTASWEVRAMAAFSHFTYYKSGRKLIVCDLQGRYRHDRSGRKSRFELTDPAICSTHRGYGPTDLGEKGIDSFFANHECNEFCQSHWSKPHASHQWFARTRGTTMLPSRFTSKLNLQDRFEFTGVALAGIME